MNLKRGRYWQALLSLGITVISGSVAAAQAPDPGNYSSQQYELREYRGQRVVMRDGVRLAVDIYRPDAPGRFPGILQITPYDAGSKADIARWFAKRGYVVVVADSRGRYDSDGEWEPFSPLQKTDGFDLVQWMAGQDWSTGRIGMIGTSYSGWTQWWTASEAPPALKAIAPTMAPPDEFRNIPYEEGLLRADLLDWAATTSGHVAQSKGEGTNGGFAATDARDLWHTPYIEINQARGMLNAPWFEAFMRNNLSSLQSWKDISYQGEANYKKITVPSLNITGWFDADQPGSPMNYVGMKKYGATPEARQPKLIIGPWPHTAFPWDVRKVGKVDYGANAVVDLRGYTARWFDHYLKGADNGVERDPPVYVFVMGPNKWRAEKDWPLPETQWTKYYFQSGGNANTLNGDGLLSTEPPAKPGADRYVYDPAKPTLAPWTGGVDAADARIPEIGKDVLVYTTPPLANDVEVTGPIEVKLFASTSAKDTDWIVHLVDVHPDGYAAIVAEGVMRARNRDPKNGGAFNSEKLSTIKPNEVYEYTVNFWRITGNVFAKGDRIRVDISSSYYPYFLRNLNTGADNVALVKETEAVVATQTVYHGPIYSSHIVLPVIPARSTADRR